MAAKVGVELVVGSGADSVGKPMPRYIDDGHKAELARRRSQSATREQFSSRRPNLPTDPTVGEGLNPAAINCELWVIQYKCTTNGYPSAAAVDQVGEAGRYYKADRLYVATSRRAGPAMLDAIRRWAALGITIGIFGARDAARDGAA